jgi:hypothetical protein
MGHGGELRQQLLGGQVGLLVVCISPVRCNLQMTVEAVNQMFFCPADFRRRGADLQDPSRWCSGSGWAIFRLPLLLRFELLSDLSRYIVEAPWDSPFWLTEGTMATGFNVRVGDADREAVAAQLREHYADGRLTLDELNERLDQTFAAKTRVELDAVMRDLPHVARPLTGAPAGGFGNTTWQGSAGPEGSAWPGPAGIPGSDWDNGTGYGRRSRPYAFAPLLGLVWIFVIIGAVMLFGIGGGDRPIAIVLILAALAFLKRLFGFRGRGRGSRGPRGPRGPRRGSRPRGPRL